MDGHWKPRWNAAAELEKLPLTAQETFVLTRLDGHTTVSQLPALTGMSSDQLSEVLNKLITHGAVHAPEPPAQPANAPEPAPDDALDVAADETPEAAEASGTHRKLFETQLHDLPADERTARAQRDPEPYLSAFCFDPLPQVVAAALQNPNAGLTQARLVAQHHRHPSGLEALTRNGAFVQDAGVRRWLLRNPQLPASLFTRLFANRRMLELFQFAASREIPEQTRRLSREALRRRFATGTAEERVELILKTEGRALAGLAGISVDGKTVALLCGRTYTNTTLIQNIARWSAAPPPLIAQLLRQESVKRSPALRTLLQRHPNAPSNATGA